MNPAAVDWVGAELLRYDPVKIPIVLSAFGEFRWPITSFSTDEVYVVGDAGIGAADDVLASQDNALSVVHPVGWRDAVLACNESGPDSSVVRSPQHQARDERERYA